MLNGAIDPSRTRRAYIVDELVLQRSRIEHLLTSALKLEVVGVCDSLRDFLARLRQTDRTRWPHLLVLNLPADPWSPQDLSALAALRDAGIRVLALTHATTRTTARRLADRGTEGFLSTSDSEEDFVAAATIVLGGGTIVTPHARAILDTASEGTQLSAQESRALTLYANGLTIGQVADAMGIRHDTARKYLTRVRNKFTSAGRPARTKLQLAQIAWSDGYAEPTSHNRPIAGSA